MSTKDAAYMSVCISVPLSDSQAQPLAAAALAFPDIIFRLTKCTLSHPELCILRNKLPAAFLGYGFISCLGSSIKS